MFTFAWEKIKVSKADEELKDLEMRVQCGMPVQPYERAFMRESGSKWWDFETELWVPDVLEVSESEVAQQAQDRHDHGRLLNDGAMPEVVTAANILSSHSDVFNPIVEIEMVANTMESLCPEVAKDLDEIAAVEKKFLAVARSHAGDLVHIDGYENAYTVKWLYKHLFDVEVDGYCIKGRNKWQPYLSLVFNERDDIATAIHSRSSYAMIWHTRRVNRAWYSSSKYFLNAKQAFDVISWRVLDMVHNLNLVDTKCAGYTCDSDVFNDDRMRCMFCRSHWCLSDCDRDAYDPSPYIGFTPHQSEASTMVPLNEACENFVRHTSSYFPLCDNDLSYIFRIKYNPLTAMQYRSNFFKFKKAIYIKSFCRNLSKRFRDRFAPPQLCAQAKATRYRGFLYYRRTTMIRSVSIDFVYMDYERKCLNSHFARDVLMFHQNCKMLDMMDRTEKSGLFEAPFEELCITR